MTTTALIVEMIIIGLQVAIWLLMLMALVWHPDVQALDRFEKFSTPLTLVAVGLCYSIGLVVDAFTAWLEDRLVPSHISDEERDRRILMRQKLRLTDRELYADLDRDQYLLRLLRSTAFNILVISLLGSALVLESIGWTKPNAWGYVLALLLVAFMAGHGWWRRRCNFVTHRDAFYRALKENSVNT